MDIHVPTSLRMVHQCFYQLAFLLLVTRPFLTDAQCLPGDTTGPTLTCVNTIVLTPALPNTLFGVSPAQYTASDPSGIDPTTTTNPTTGAPAAGGFLFPPGSTPLELTVRDTCGNPSVCTININNALTALPVNNCPDFSTTVNTDTGEATATISAPNYGSADVRTDGTYFYHGSGTQPSVVFATTTPPGLAGPPFQLPVGTNVVTTTISDAVLSFTCSSTIVVQDIEMPSITCPADITSNTLTVSFSAAATDNADPSPVVAYDPLDPGDTFPLGITTVTATATDSSSNSQSCMFNVTVVDNEMPSITCPADFTSNTLTVSFSVTVTDNADPSPVVTYDPLGPGAVFPLGPTTVTATATDSSSNSQSCTFTVTVSEPTTTIPTTTVAQGSIEASSEESGENSTNNSAENSSEDSSDDSSNES